MTLNSLRQKMVARRMERETGSDVVVTLFMIPFVLALVFALIDVSSYFSTRAQVQNIARDGARQVALYGGTSAGLPLNRQVLGGKEITNVVKAKLYADGNCLLSTCSAPPVVTCSPERATNLNQDAVCSIKYKYASIGGGLVEWLGFGSIVEQEINISESFKVEVRY